MSCAGERFAQWLKNIAIKVRSLCSSTIPQIFLRLGRNKSLSVLAEEKLLGPEFFDLVAEFGGFFELEFFGGVAHFGF